MTLRIYHNARCSKSRSACSILAERGMTPEVIEYLNTPPTADELRALLKKLALPAEAIVRTGEDVFKANYVGRVLSEEEWIAALVANPILIERPIVVMGDRAIIARPPEKLLEWLDAAGSAE